MAVPQVLEEKDVWMKYYNFLFISSLFMAAALLTGCAGNQTVVDATPTATASVAVTTDLCAPGNIEAEVNKVHKHMREFDDTSTVAANMPQEQISNAIIDLQRIRREAEDEPIPSCLVSLKTYQIAHMNSVINTLVAFMGGSDQKIVDQYLALARQQHDQYTLELARVLGLTVVPATIPSASGTPPPSP
jgi:uncharacterized lipoprotein YajG